MTHLNKAVLGALVAFAIAPLHADVSRVPQGTELPHQLKDVGIDQRLNAQLPLDTPFTDDDGRGVRLGDVLGKRPAILAFLYHECPMLCSMVLNGLVRTIRPLDFNAGKDYDIIAISFEPTDTVKLAHEKKLESIERYKRPSADPAGWHFLTGDAASIRKVTEAAGFRYSRDPATGQWAHASAIMVLTPGGRLARYFYGVEYSVRDLRFGLVDASQGKIGTAVDQILLFCFHYDPITGKYGFIIMTAVRIGAILTALAVVAFWWSSYRQSRRRKFNHENLTAIS